MQTTRIQTEKMEMISVKLVTLTLRAQGGWVGGYDLGSFLLEIFASTFPTDAVGAPV